MVNLLKTSLAAMAGLLLGLGATILVVKRGLSFGTVQAGVWTADPMAGSPDIDPYGKARLAYSGEMPLGVAEGLTLTATRDETGAVLLGTCDYDVTGRMPPARYWTLTPSTPQGELINSDLSRRGMNSSEILRREDGDFHISLGRSARPGNWLPVETGSPFVLVLRLYDTAISSTSTAIEASAFPLIQRVTCQ